jgi:hypothetical protein
MSNLFKIITNISSGILSSFILDVLVLEDAGDVISEVILGDDLDLLGFAIDGDFFKEEGILYNLFIYYLFI